MAGSGYGPLTRLQGRQTMRRVTYVPSEWVTEAGFTSPAWPTPENQRPARRGVGLTLLRRVGAFLAGGIVGYGMTVLGPYPLSGDDLQR
jgi:hypothetical protein